MVYYVDSSALVKLIRTEDHSGALRRFLADAELVSCHLVLVEIPRAVRRLAAGWRQAQVEALLARADTLLGACALRPLDRELLGGAGALARPELRSLDAVHVAAALRLAPLDGFVTYDERQAAAARLHGLSTSRPEDV